MFTAALSATGNNWKQPKNPLIGIKTNKHQNYVSMEYYATLEMKYFFFYKLLEGKTSLPT